MSSMSKILKNTPLFISGAICLAFISSSVTAESQPINGAEVFNNNCARCHNARGLDEFSLEEWAVIMPHMREKAHLTGNETDAVMQFAALVKGDSGNGETPKQKQATLSGEGLFTKYSCQGCHSVKGQGGSVGPALDSIIDSKGVVFFIQKLKNPQFNNPSSPMPKMRLNDAEIDALSDYLKTL
ncbi:MAG: mono/diheme cytochrome c family protein [Arenicella sp.]|jgi:mono/diheme cytochrome c family protein